MHNILIVENNDIRREALVSFTRVEGYHPTTATNAEEGLNMALNYDFNVVIIGSQLMDAPPNAVLAYLRKYKQTPVLMFTSDTEQQVSSEPHQVKANAYLNENCDQPALSQVLRYMTQFSETIAPRHVHTLHRLHTAS